MTAAPETPPDVVRRGFRILGYAIREQPRIFAVSAVGSALFATMIAGQAYVLGEVTQRVVLPAFRDGRTTAGAVAGAALAVLAVSLLKATGVIARRLGAGIMQYRLNAAYRRRVTRQYLRLPLSWHQRHPTGQLLSNANADVDATWQVIAPFPFFIGTMVLLVVTGVLLVVTDPVLAAVGFVVFPLLAVVNAVFSRLLAPRMTVAQELRGTVSARAHESFDGSLVVKTLGREDAETASFAAVSQRLRDQLVGVGRVRAVFDPLMEVLPSLGVLAVLWVGTSRVASGVLETGELVRVAYLFTLLALPLRAVAWVLGSLPQTVVGWRRLRAVLDADGHTEHGDRPLAGSGPVAVELRGLALGYGGQPVLTNVDLRLPAGRTVALVGTTGAGKSTLVSALLRLVEPLAGSVRLDGSDVRELEPGALAAAAALVPQSTFLFDDTVRGNVTLGADVPDEDVWAALRLAQADGFVAALPQGLDTVVGERGASLSGGQRQRVALARALVRRPRLLVLDDATSSVDPQVEAAILAGLRGAGLPSTVVLVAYRRATIELADEVVLLDGGTVAARGTHAELLERSPAYVDIVTAYERAERERAGAGAA